MGKEINIKVLHATLYLQMGGLETVIMNLCRQKNANKFSLEVLCFNKCDPIYKAELEKNGVTVHVIQREGRFNFGFFRKIINLLKKQEIDVLHAHSGCVFNAILCAWLAKTPVKIFTEHGLPFFADGSPMPVTYQTRIEDWFIGQISSHLIAVSDEIYESLAVRYPAAQKRMCLIPNGVDTDLFDIKMSPELLVAVKHKYHLPMDKFFIGSVGRLAPVKNYSSLLRSLALLENGNKSYHLVLVGNGPEMETLDKLAVELNVHEDVSFLGVQYDLQDVFPLFDVFVLPSWTEGTSISLLEALSCGVPAIVSDVGGNPNVVEDGVSGFLFPVNQPSKIAKNIKLLFDDPNKFNNMQRKARSRIVGRYDVKTMVKKYEELYTKLFLI